MENEDMINCGVKSVNTTTTLMEFGMFRAVKTPTVYPFPIMEKRLAKKTMIKRPPKIPSRGPVGEMVLQTPNSNALNLNDILIKWNIY